MNNPAFGALRARGVSLLVIRNGVVEGAGAYHPGLAPVAVVAGSSLEEDERLIARAVESVVMEPPSR